MTGTPLPPTTTYEYGLEHHVVPEGGGWNPSLPVTERFGSPLPYTWAPHHVDVPMVGIRILTRYYVQATTTTPGTGTPGQPGYVPGSTTVTRTYPSWNLTEQELICISDPEDSLFKNYTGEELFTAAPGFYTSFAVSGIRDETEYNVFEVFDQSIVDWIPRLTKPGRWDIFNETDPPLYTETGIPPAKPYDETVNPPRYPVDAFTKFDLDTREVVPVVYQLTTKYGGGIDPIFGTPYPGGVNTITVTHPVLPPVKGWAHLVTEYVKGTYYYHGYYPYLHRDYEQGGIYE